MTPNSAKETMHAYQIDDDESPSLAVIRAVSAFSDIPVTELDPLFQTVDPEAIDTILDSAGDGCISFHYHGFDVTVYGDEVTIEEKQG